MPNPFWITLILAAAGPHTFQDQDSPQIIVTGKRLDDTEAALRDCIARTCPPAEEMAATVDHAENQFVSGDYRGARATLKKGLRRNRKYEASDTLAVS